MFDFIQNQKRKVIAIAMIIMMAITVFPISSLAADTKAPTVTINVKSGRIKNGTQLSFTIKDDSPLKVIYYQWDRNIDKNSEPQFHFFSESTTNYTFKLPASFSTLGLHELSIAARDDKGNMNKWIDIPYYVVAENVSSTYVDNVKPTFIINSPTDYPYSGSTIAQGTKIKIKMQDENDIYWLGYKWVRELNLSDYATGSTFVYKPGSEFTFTAPQERGKWYLQFYAKDGASNISTGRWSEYTVADMVKPVLTLNGPANVDVSQYGTYNDPGASWTDNVDGKGTVYAREK